MTTLNIFLIQGYLKANRNVSKGEDNLNRNIRMFYKFCTEQKVSRLLQYFFVQLTELVFYFHAFLFLFQVNAYGQSKEVDLIIPPTDVGGEGMQEQISILDLVSGATPVVKFVLLALVIMSIVTWGIIITKTYKLLRARSQTAEFQDVFWKSRNLSQIHEASNRLTESPVAKVYVAGHRELATLVRSSDKNSSEDISGLDNIDRALKKAKFEEATRLEYGTGFLATTASAAPFIGLFGTVWGIMNAFIGLSHVKSSSIQAVAPGIAEALVATAIGLFAAIPAYIAFNSFSQQIRLLNRSMEMFTAEFLNMAKRDFFS
jgi:biopolymer transport protein TolQ